MTKIASFRGFAATPDAGGRAKLTEFKALGTENKVATNAKLSLATNGSLAVIDPGEKPPKQVADWTAARKGMGQAWSHFIDRKYRPLAAFLGDSEAAELRGHMDKAKKTIAYIVRDREPSGRGPKISLRRKDKSAAALKGIGYNNAKQVIGKLEDKWRDKYQSFVAELRKDPQKLWSHLQEDIRAQKDSSLAAGIPMNSGKSAVREKLFRQGRWGISHDFLAEEAEKLSPAEKKEAEQRVRVLRSIEPTTAEAIKYADQMGKLQNELKRGARRPPPPRPSKGPASKKSMGEASTARSVAESTRPKPEKPSKPPSISDLRRLSKSPPSSR